MTKTILSVMPDYGWAFLWKKSGSDLGIGGNIGDGMGYYKSLPFSEALWQKFRDWSAKFDYAYFYPSDIKADVTDRDGNPIEWDWDIYHQEGIELTKLLKKEVGDEYVVRYVKPYEDDISQGFRIAEISLEGKVIPLVYDEALECYVRIS